MRYGGQSGSYGGVGSFALISGGSITGITDLAVADGGTGASTAQAAAANLKVPYVLAQSGSSVTAPEDTNENTLATITIPANALGANGRIVARFHMTSAGGTGNKTMKVRYSGASGTQYLSFNYSTQGFMVIEVHIANLNATNSQAGYALTMAGSSPQNTSATSSVDTTAETTLLLTITKATGSDNAVLRSYSVWITQP